MIKYIGGKVTSINFKFKQVGKWTWVDCVFKLDKRYICDSGYVNSTVKVLLLRS